MFNLIVSGGLGSDRQGSILADRVLEYTSDSTEATFKPKGQLNESAVCALPTIFMREGTSDEVVSIGWLARVELRGREYKLQYCPSAEFLRPRVS